MTAPARAQRFHGPASTRPRGWGVTPAGAHTRTAGEIFLMCRGSEPLRGPTKGRQMSTCPQCDAEVEQPGRGRPRRFCSNICRKKFDQRARTLRGQVERYGYLAAVNPEPYSSMWAAREAEARAELSKTSNEKEITS